MGKTCPGCGIEFVGIEKYCTRRCGDRSRAVMVAEVPVEVFDSVVVKPGKAVYIGPPDAVIEVTVIDGPGVCPTCRRPLRAMTGAERVRRHRAKGGSS